MKKISRFALSIVLLGTSLPLTIVNAQTTESSEQTIVTRQGVTGTKSYPVNNVDGTVDFLGKSWDVIKDYGNGNKMIAMQDKIADSQFNPEFYFNTNDDNSNGYQDSLVKSLVDEWYRSNISGTAYEQFIQPVTLSNPTLGPIKRTYGWSSNSDTTGSIGYTPWINTILAPDNYPTIVGGGEKQAFLMSASDVTKSAGNLSDAVIKHITNLSEKGISTSWLSTVGGYSNFASDLMSGSPEVRNHRVTEVESVVPSLVVQSFNDGASLTVKYVDTEGNIISEDVVKSGALGEQYTTEQKEIKGYTFKEVQGNVTGKFTDQPQIVTYVYTTNPVISGNVTAKYVDTEGNIISEDVVKSGALGEQYTTEQKEINGYTFKEAQGDVTGKFTDQPQTVTYIYTKNVVASASRPDNKENSSFENKNTLPQTGESESISIVGMILGTLLVLGAAILFRFKRKINK